MRFGGAGEVLKPGKEYETKSNSLRMIQRVYFGEGFCVVGLEDGDS